MLNSFLFDSIYWSITLCIPIPQCFHIQYLGLMPKISSQLLLVSVLVFIEMVTWKKMLSFSCSLNFHFHGLYIYIRVYFMLFACYDSETHYLSNFHNVRHGGNYGIVCSHWSINVLKDAETLERLLEMTNVLQDAETI